MALLGVWRPAGATFRGDQQDSGAPAPAGAAERGPERRHGSARRGPQTESNRI